MIRCMRRWKLMAGVFVVAAALLLPELALAGPRSGGSFGGRGGFRAPSSGFRTPSSSPRGGGYSSRGGGYGTGPSIFFFPGFGGFGGGCGGGGLIGGVILVLALGMAAAAVAGAVRRFRAGGTSWNEDDDEPVQMNQAYVYRAQIALGRSARAIQERLSRFAAEGDTSTASGLQVLLQQTSLELLRERDAFRYVHLDIGERQTLAQAESKMNAMALQERSRFQLERVRSAEGKVRRATEAAEEGKEALEYVMVTLVAATRSPVIEPGKKKREEPSALDQTTGLLTGLGGVPTDSLLGLEVIWTPADPDDSLTETDLLTTYPDLRSV